MPDERIIQQVNGILSMNNVPFQISDDKQSFLVPSGSAGVIISFDDWRDSSTIVTLRAVVLEQVDDSDERRLKILEALNEKNRTAPFGCFYFDAERKYVVLDYQLLADHLQEPELLNALGALGVTADKLDDELREAIGSGVLASAAWAAAQAAASDAGAGPVVAT